MRVFKKARKVHRKTPDMSESLFIKVAIQHLFIEHLRATEFFTIFI